MDIVERLRREAGGSGTYVEMARRGIMNEAADEIGRLRAKVAQVHEWQNKYAEAANGLMRCCQTVDRLRAEVNRLRETSGESGTYQQS